MTAPFLRPRSAYLLLFGCDHNMAIPHISTTHTRTMGKCGQEAEFRYTHAQSLLVLRTCSCCPKLIPFFFLRSLAQNITLSWTLTYCSMCGGAGGSPLRGMMEKRRGLSYGKKWRGEKARIPASNSGIPM